MQTSFGQRLATERQRLKLSQEALAAKIGASKRSVIDWEGETASPKATYLMKMVEVGLDTTYILTGERSSSWERDLQARTGVVVAEMEPSGDGPLHQAHLKSIKIAAAIQLARRPLIDKLQLALIACGDDDFDLVVNMAITLARRMATGQVG